MTKLVGLLHVMGEPDGAGLPNDEELRVAHCRTDAPSIVRDTKLIDIVFHHGSERSYEDEWLCPSCGVSTDNEDNPESWVFILRLLH